MSLPGFNFRKTNANKFIYGSGWAAMHVLATTKDKKFRREKYKKNADRG